ncbi:retrovirus-related pol polyprotein from transposon TNT 1-94 [Tanacetum coccineum]
MSLMGEMNFFLGLQIHQSSRGIFINQSKYALEILKKHRMNKCDSIGTPMATKLKLDADLSGHSLTKHDIKTEYQLADMFTKALSQERFEYLVGRLGIKSAKKEALHTTLDRNGVNTSATSLHKDEFCVDSFSIHSDEGNPSSVIIKQHCGTDDGVTALSPVESDSLPHDSCSCQAAKTYISI